MLGLTDKSTSSEQPLAAVNRFVLPSKTEAQALQSSSAFPTAFQSGSCFVLQKSGGRRAQFQLTRWSTPRPPAVRSQHEVVAMPCVTIRAPTDSEPEPHISSGLSSC